MRREIKYLSLEVTNLNSGVEPIHDWHLNIHEDEAERYILSYVCSVDFVAL